MPSRGGSSLTCCSIIACCCCRRAWSWGGERICCICCGVIICGDIMATDTGTCGEERQTGHARPGELRVASPCQAPRSSLKSLPQMPPVPKSSATCLMRSHHASPIWARRGHRRGCGGEVAMARRCLLHHCRNWASRAPSGTGFPTPTPAPSSPARAQKAPESWDWAPSLRVWGGEALREAGQVTAHPNNFAQQRKR